MVKKVPTQRYATGLGVSSRRLNTIKYYFKHQDYEEPMEVCKKMFLNILDMNEWMLHNWLKESTLGLAGKKTKVNDVSNDNIISTPKRAAQKKRIDHLENLFSSLAKMPSYYCRKKTNRLYLQSPFMHKSEVFEHYKSKCTGDSIIPTSICYFYSFMKQKKFYLYAKKR